MARVQPPLEFIPPHFNPWVLRLAQMVLPIWRRSGAEIAQIQADNLEQLVELYRQFQAGKIRLMLAFRHPNARDPLCLGHLIWNLLPQAAQQQGHPLRSPCHFHFIYDRGIPLWAGSFVGWGFSQLGGTPIHRGKVDWVGLRSARNLFANGQFPIAAAPEGGTNGHNELVSPLEPGVAQLGFWCQEDLQQGGRSETVLILPIGIQYHYLDASWTSIDTLLSELEAQMGLSPDPNLPTALEEVRYRRLYRLGGHLLVLMEQFYRDFYHQSLPTKENLSLPASNEELATRLNALLDAALRVAEESFYLRPKGNVIDRCRRLEQAGWERIYREDFSQLETVSPLERGLADRIAEEANLRMWHMRLVEHFVGVTGQYVQEKPSLERFAETCLLLWQTVTQIRGETKTPIPQLGPQQAHLTIGEPISVSHRWEAYKANRRSARQAVADLTQDLQRALENLVM